MSQGEDLLYRIVEHMFPYKEILRNIRPSWLFGLELDIYIPNLHIAFEFDGPQHRFPVKGMYKGKEMFKYSSKNDHWKNKACTENKITLIRISARELKPVRIRKFIIKRSHFRLPESAFASFPYELEKDCAFYRRNHAYTIKEKKFRRKNRGTLSSVGELDIVSN